MILLVATFNVFIESVEKIVLDINVIMSAVTKYSNYKLQITNSKNYACCIIAIYTELLAEIPFDKLKMPDFVSKYKPECRRTDSDM